MFPEDPSGRSELFQRPLDFKPEDLSLETPIGNATEPSEIDHREPESSSDAEVEKPKLHRLKAFLLEDDN